MTVHVRLREKKQYFKSINDKSLDDLRKDLLEATKQKLHSKSAYKLGNTKNIHEYKKSKVKIAQILTAITNKKS